MRRGPKATDPVESGFWKLSNCNDWVTAVEVFGARPEPVDVLQSRSPPVDASRRGPLCDGCGYPQKFLRTIGQPDSVVPGVVVPEMRSVVSRWPSCSRPARSRPPSGLRGAATGSCAPALVEQAEGCAVTGDGCSDTDSMEAQEDTKEGSAGAGGGAQRSDEREEAA